MSDLIHNAEDITLNNRNEVDEILGRPPGWLLKWGISILFLITCFFMSIVWVIKYPDTLPAEVSIVTENPAIRVLSKSAGKITNLLKEDHQYIQKNDLIAIIENPAKLSDIEKLDSLINEIKNIKFPKNYLKIGLLESCNLGNLQASYAALEQKVKAYQHFIRTSDVFKKISTLEDQIFHTQRLTKNLKKQKRSLEEEFFLIQKDFRRNQSLNTSGTVSDLALEQSKTKVLQHKRQIDGLENQIINNDITLGQIKSQIIELKQGRKNDRSSQELLILEDIEKIKSEIKAWKSNYLIFAPIAGKISFSKPWSEQQFINTNEDLLTIVPLQGTGKIVGRAFLPIINYGKVKPGQIVNIQLDGFPAQEYGILKSRIKEISSVPVNDDKEDYYLLELELLNELQTSYHRNIPFRQEMLGTAEIITEDRRVIDRIFDRFNSILKNT